MGVKDMNKFILTYAPRAIEKINLDAYKNKSIVFDTSYVIYNFVTAIRRSGKDLTNKKGQIVSHLYCIFQMNLKLIKRNITPIYVFDGKPPAIKRKILDERDYQKEQRKLTLKEKEEKVTEEHLKKKLKIQHFQGSYEISHEQIMELKKMLLLMGVPIVDAPEEADSQCAMMAKKDPNITGVFTRDNDVLVFGSPYLIQKIDFQKNVSTQVNLQTILRKTGLNYDQFIELAILMGTDYGPTIKGIGYKSAYQLIKKHGNLKEVVSYLNKQSKYMVQCLDLSLGHSVPKSSSRTVPDGFYKHCKEIKKYFLNPTTTPLSKLDLQLKPIQKDKLEKLMITEYNIKKESVEKYLLTG